MECAIARPDAPPTNRACVESACPRRRSDVISEARRSVADESGPSRSSCRWGDETYAQTAQPWAGGAVGASATGSREWSGNDDDDLRSLAARVVRQSVSEVLQVEPIEVTLTRAPGESLGLGLSDDADGGYPLVSEVLPGTPADLPAAIRGRPW